MAVDLSFFIKMHAKLRARRTLSDKTKANPAFWRSRSFSVSSSLLMTIALSDYAIAAGPSGNGLEAATNVILAATPSVYGTVTRSGYYVVGDVSPITYTASASPCSLNSGAGDGGSQVPSSDSKCWIAAFTTGGIDVRQFGARCDGTTNDATALQAAITFAGTLRSGVVQLPYANLCKVNSTLNFGDNVTLRGTGIAGNSGLTSGIINLNPMLSLGGQNNRVESMRIVANGAGVNTSGQVISTAVKGLDILRDLYIVGSCDGIDISGNQHSVENITIYQAAGTGCNAIKVGSKTTSAGSTDIIFNHVVVSASTTNKPDSCFLIIDAGGIFITHSDAILCKVGTKVAPGANQQVIWATFSSTYLGDTNSDYAFVIDPAAATGVVKGLSCSQCWASSQDNTSGAGVLIANTNGGTVAGLSFDGLRSFGNAGDGVRIFYGADTTFSNTRICGYGLSGIYQASSSGGKLSVSDSTISPTCASQSGTGSTGIFINSGNSNIRLSNVDVIDNSTKIAGVPTGNSIVSNIHGVDEFFVSVASAATIDLNSVAPNWIITGTTAISNMASPWNGRKVLLVTSGGSVNFLTGGNICNSFTSTINLPVNAIYSGSCWYLS